MYNVDTLTVCRPLRIPGVSRMTITLRENDQARVDQVVRRWCSPEVISVKNLDTDHSYWREVAIVKLEIDASRVGDPFMVAITEILGTKVTITILQVAGSTRRIDAFLDEVGQEHIVEIARTGVTAMEK